MNPVRILLVCLALAAGLLSMPASAYAESGTVTKVEFNSICTTQDNFTVGCAQPDTQNQLEDFADVTGSVLATWTPAGGVPHKNMHYNGSGTSVDVIVTFKKPGDSWKATDNLWCEPDRCYDLNVPVR